MKKLKMILAVLMAAVLMAGCTSQTSEAPVQTTSPEINTQTDAEARAEVPATEEAVTIHIGALKGPTAIGMIELMENDEKSETANDYEFTLAGAADELSAAIVQGRLDVAAVPCNLASVLYQKTEGAVQVAAVNTLGVLYLVETGESIQTVADLKGKTIYSTGKGTTPQYTLNYLLTANGINPETDVTIEYKTEATEVAAAMAEAEDAVAMLPQPYVTSVLMTNENLRIALDVTAEWDKISNGESNVVTGVVLMRKEFAEEHPQAVASFMEEYQASTEYVNANVSDAGALVEKFGIVAKAAIATKAIPYCNITFIRGEEMKNKIAGYLQILFDQNPQAVGGSMPEDDFYFMTE